jgi:hypothetical protein
MASYLVIISSIQQRTSYDISDPLLFQLDPMLFARCMEHGKSRYPARLTEQKQKTAAEAAAYFHYRSR